MEHRVQGLDGLRAVAVSLVLLAHSADMRGVPHSLTYLIATLNFGSLGVWLFFCISGFIITHLLLREEQKKSRISLKFFWQRRALRIMPPLLGFMCVMLIVANFAPGIDISASEIFPAITFTVGLWGSSTWWFGHTWSLAIEEQFYIIWPLLFLACTIANRLRNLLVVSAFAITILGISELFGIGSKYLSQSLFPLNFVYLAAGCTLALLRQKNHHLLVRFAKNSEAIRILIGFSLLATARILMTRPSVPAVFINILEAIGLILLIHVAIESKSWLAGVLAWRPMVLLGGISYSLYLWQQLFLGRFGQSWWQQLPQALLFAVICAVLSYWILERPFFALRDRLKP